jgi:hypothetical protein
MITISEGAQQGIDQNTGKISKRFVRVVITHNNGHETYRLININNIEYIEASENANGSYTYKLYYRTGKNGEDCVKISQDLYEYLEEEYAL